MTQASAEVYGVSLRSVCFLLSHPDDGGGRCGKPRRRGFPRTCGRVRASMSPAGSTGLRCGEIIALRWSDVDWKKREITVALSEWKGHVGVPKGGRSRRVPMTDTLHEALRTHRHLRGSNVVCGDDGVRLTQKMVQVVTRRVATGAKLKPGVHILRHTFCSHLAMRGAPARAIQELAGHEDLGTTQRYMHLSPAALDAAIRLLDTPAGVFARGDIGETDSTEIVNSSR